MDYIIVPTSNSNYQSWQCRVLNWSRKKVKQSGKLIFLRCKDEMGRNRPLDTYKDPDVQVIDLPDYSLDWEYAEEQAKRGEKYWWGAIPNKYMSIKWLCDNNYFNDSDNLLFMDPDMVFLEPINYQPKDNEIIAQRFIHYLPLNNWTTWPDEQSGDGIMYPFCINFKTLKTIIEDYKSSSEGIRRETKKWESEMWGLDYAAKKNNLDITFVENFGFCTAWKSEGDTDVSKIIHFPNSIEDRNQQPLFFKQDYTFNPTVKIDIHKSKNMIDKLLMTNITQERTDFLYYLKWNYQNLFENYDGTRGYLILRPWPGGFNNIRMSLELAVCIAYITNKTLVLPPKYKMYLLQDEFGLEDFFDVHDLGIKTMSLETFAQLKNIDATFDAVTSISKVIQEPDNHVLNFTNTTPNVKFTKGRPVSDMLKILGDDECVFFDGKLLGNFYQTIYTDLDIELKKLVARHVHYNVPILDMGWQAVNWMEDKSYYAIHIRRNDFQYKNLFITSEEIYNNIKDIIPEGSKLYIATDHTDKEFFNILSQHYQLYFYNDVAEAIGIQPHYNYIPIIEQLICTRAIKFIGNDYSTLSSYIYRLRGYMSDIEDKNFYANTSSYQEEDQKSFIECSKFIANWAREYKDVWDFSKDRIFISVASYDDTQLIPTLENLYKKTSDISRITVGVHIQDDYEQYEKLLSYNFPNIKIIFTPKEKSLGVVWAREKIKHELFTNEDFFLQIDAHSRFKQDWDNIILKQYYNIGDANTIISTYPNHFDLEEQNEEYIERTPTNAPLKIRGFLNEEKNNNLLNPENLGALKSDEVVDSRWLAGGFLFAPKRWVHDVRTPDGVHGKGEEDVAFILSYLQGWNIKVPGEAIIWHNYNNIGLDGAKYRIPNVRLVHSNSSNILNHILSQQKYSRTVQELEEYLNIEFKPIKPKTIFVSIASFRDEQLERTVRTCLANAKNPENIKIGICWQYDESENLNMFDGDSRIQTHKVYWKDAEGSVCWARKLIQEKFFRDEDFYMQVDSHTIFAVNWDELLINMYHQLPTRKGIISVGPPYYYDMSAPAALPPRPEDITESRSDGLLYDCVVQKQKIDDINPGTSYFTYGFLPAENLNKPIPARHISAAIVFAPGDWVREVPYDPNLYFHGEEATLALRSWTRGWDIFNPNGFVAWHLKYYFPDRLRHWNTFDQNIIDNLSSKSYQRFCKILRSDDGGKDLGIYGLGDERTVEDWEIYSGVSYRHGVAHPDVYNGITPNPITVKQNWDEWLNYKKIEAAQYLIRRKEVSLNVLAWAMEDNLEIAREKSKFLLETAKIHNVNINFVGIGETFNPRDTRSRLKILQDVLRKNYKYQDIVLVMDGYDTLVNNNVNYTLEKFLQADTRILISAEQIFTYQYGNYQSKFETISSPYKYVNAGTYMGYAGDMIQMIDEMLSIPAPYNSEIDQGLLGVWAFNNFENDKRMKMDINCEVFWVTSKDWHLLKNTAEQTTSQIIKNSNTDTQPFVIHNVGNSDPYHYQAFLETYKKITGKNDV